ncbi:hypothetical protein BD769DRAFT_58559 [Suillus cothurnatus]|nr:hypothetical protein BD769DRAFT_58559 [Suillus cothurnatus]
MLVIHPASCCDVCLDPYSTSSGRAHSPHAIACGHVFCLTCVPTPCQVPSSNHVSPIICDPSIPDAFTPYPQSHVPSAVNLSSQIVSRNSTSQIHPHETISNRILLTINMLVSFSIVFL